MNKHLKNILIILVISVVITFGFDYFIGGVSGNIETIALNILYGFIIGGTISLSGFLTRYILKISDTEIYPIKTYVILLVSVTLYISIAVFGVNAIWIKLVFGHSPLSVFTSTGTMLVSIATIFVGLIIYFIILSKSYLTKLLDSEKQIQEANAQSAKFQYDLLKHQVNPHFLFNSLNILTSLIHKDADKAEEYTLALSRIYSYILDHQDDELVELEEELNFIKKYSYLQSIRFDDNFKVEFNVEKETNNKWIIPMALQMLLENVIKHNTVSDEKPILVTIKITEDFIEVQNPLQLKNSSDNSYKLGLNNIEKRYEALSDKKCEIVQSESTFTVRLPLLSVQK